MIEDAKYSKFDDIYARRKIIYWVIKFVAKGEVCEGGWEMIYGVIEIVSECEVGDGGREVVYGLVEGVP